MEEPEHKLGLIFDVPSQYDSEESVEKAVQRGVVRFKKLKKKFEQGIRVLDLITALSDSFDPSSLLASLIQFKILRSITGNWEFVKASKMFGLIVLSWDQLLDNLS